MAVIQLIVALVVLGILYSRMIRREFPTPVEKVQAVLPVILGIVSLPLSFGFFIMIGKILVATGSSAEGMVEWLHSIRAATLGAGLPEEVAKLILMVITLLIFRSKIRNVYEYILIGAAIGFGFTLFEEFSYGTNGGILDAVGRLVTVAGHMCFGMVMAKHLGMAKYNKVHGTGSVAGNYILAFLIPFIIHVLYDACTAHNYLMRSDGVMISGIGMAFSIIAVVALFIWQIVLLRRFKRDTEKYCDMTVNSAN